MQANAYTLLNLLQLTDSALPIGATAHSFGLETLASEAEIQVEGLHVLLSDYLAETGVLEAVYCRAAHRTVLTSDRTEYSQAGWSTLNAQVSAWKTVRESRVASGTLGRRLLRMVSVLEATDILAEAAESAARADIEAHHCVAFGLVGAVLQFDEDTTALAYLQQAVTAAVSASQRLLPLGQNRAMQILWDLKFALVDAMERSRDISCETVGCFAPLLDIGSMRHPALATRLFIS